MLDIDASLVARLPGLDCREDRPGQPIPSLDDTDGVPRKLPIAVLATVPRLDVWLDVSPTRQIRANLVAVVR